MQQLAQALRRNMVARRIDPYAVFALALEQQEQALGDSATGMATDDADDDNDDNDDGDVASGSKRKRVEETRAAAAPPPSAALLDDSVSLQLGDAQSVLERCAPDFAPSDIAAAARHIADANSGRVSLARFRDAFELPERERVAQVVRDAEQRRALQQALAATPAKWRCKNWYFVSLLVFLKLLVCLIGCSSFEYFVGFRCLLARMSTRPMTMCVQCAS